MSAPVADDPGGGTDEPPQRFFIAHMQKTAGTTVRDRLRSSFSDDQIYPNVSDGPRILHAVISVRHLQERWAVRGDEIRLLTGHFPLRTVEVLDAPFVRLTVLRDPVERTLSFLRHQAERRQRGAREATPLDEIYADPFRFNAMIHNHMVRVLSLAPDEWGPGDGVPTTVPYTRERLEMAKEALAGIEMFGLQHRLDEFCDELADRYGLAVGDPVHSNTTDPVETPAGLAERIAEDNALDMELYDYACKLYEVRQP
jgi:hypothetical protein